MVTSQLTVIGCGVFGRAIIDGLSSGAGEQYHLALTHRRAEVAEKLQDDYPQALVTTDNTDTRIWASPPHSRSRHVVVIATQPSYTAGVCHEIRQAYTAAGATQQLVVVTVCPGITIAQLELWLPAATAIVRSMPNTPIAVRQGATALFPSPATPPAVVSEIRSIFQGMSPVVVLLPREDLMDIVASISGSAPAYFFHLLQSLVAAGAARGLPVEIGHQLVVQSCLGAARLAEAAPDTSLLELLADVCVAGGSTEKAIRTLDRLDTRGAVRAAVEESWRANRAMGEGTEGKNRAVGAGAEGKQCSSSRQSVATVL